MGGREAENMEPLLSFRKVSFLFSLIVNSSEISSVSLKPLTASFSALQIREQGRVKGPVLC